MPVSVRTKAALVAALATVLAAVTVVVVLSRPAGESTEELSASRRRQTVLEVEFALDEYYLTHRAYPLGDRPERAVVVAPARIQDRDGVLDVEYPEVEWPWGTDHYAHCSCSGEANPANVRFTVRIKGPLSPLGSVRDHAMVTILRRDGTATTPVLATVGLQLGKAQLGWAWHYAIADFPIEWRGARAFLVSFDEHQWAFAIPRS